MTEGLAVVLDNQVKELRYGPERGSVPQKERAGGYKIQLCGLLKCVRTVCMEADGTGLSIRQDMC